MQVSLDSFVATRGTRRALAIVRALIQDPSRAPRLVVLHGPTGIGKTHLLRAALSEAARQPGRPVHAKTASELVQEIVSGRTARASTPGLLAVDDLHTLVGLLMSQQEVGWLFDDHVRAGGTLLAAAGVPLSDLEGLMRRLRLIESAKFIELRPPDPREMARLLRVLAARERIELEPADAIRVAVRCRGDVRLAQGAIARRRIVRSLPQPGNP